MSAPVFSPDGKWMWTGSEWIPSPPQNSMTVLEQSEELTAVASEVDVSTGELRARTSYLDINQDGIIQNNELQMAGQSIINPIPTTAYPQVQQPVMQPTQPAMQPIQPAMQPIQPVMQPIQHPFPMQNVSPQIHLQTVNAPHLSSVQIKKKRSITPIVATLTVAISIGTVALILTNSSLYVGFTSMFTDDSDGDGVDDTDDAFPDDASEWEDLDGDGIGDNEDDDDDGDGVPEHLDVNDRVDMAMILNLETFKVIEKMDYWDNQAEIYICVYLNGTSQGCAPGENYYWSLETSATYDIAFEFFADLPDDQRYHEIQITTWDSDAFDDDIMDISPDSEWNSYVFTYDCVMETFGLSTTASGEGDGGGWDGVLTFRIEPLNLISQRFNAFEWNFRGDLFSLSLNLDRSVYTHFKNLDHSVSQNEDYTRFSTPDEQYVKEISNQLEEMAENNGYTSNLDKAEFILAFVGAIQYVTDIEGSEQIEYPKYPIEMLWEGVGDCEDASALYISLMEAIGEDTVLVLLLVKQNEDEEWGGHAMVGISIQGGSGSYFQMGSGNKADIEFYIAETTGWKDGISGIGVNPWSEMDDINLYDIE